MTSKGGAEGDVLGRVSTGAESSLNVSLEGLLACRGPKEFCILSLQMKEMIL
jgi:hypothetical protein